MDDKQTGENVIGTIAEISKIHNKDKEVKFIVAIGNNQLRQKIFKQYRELINYIAIHPSAIVSNTAKIGNGTMIGAGTIINANTVIEDNCIINTGSIVEHDCYIKEGAHLSYRTTVGAGTEIGKLAYLELGTIVDRNVKIQDEENTQIGSIIRRKV